MGEFVRNNSSKTAGIESAVSKLFMLVETHFLLLSQNDPLAIVTQLELKQSNQDLRLKINEVLKATYKLWMRF